MLVADKIAGTATLPVGGEGLQVKATFPVSALRRIRIEMTGGIIVGVNVAAVGEVTATGRTYPLVTLIGDSFPEGTGSNQNWDGEGISLLRALGFNPANASVGGSGILNPSSGGRVNWQDSNRLVDLALNGVTDAITAAASVPSMGVIMMSVNDADQQSANWGGAASYRDAIKKGLWVLIDHWNTQRAGKPLVVFGPTTSNGSPVVLDLYRSRDAGQEAVAGASGGNIWFLDRLDASPKLRDGLLTRVTTTGDTHSSSLLDGLASTAGVSVGTGVWGSGIPDGARVAVVNSAVSVTLDVAATSTLVGTSIQFLFTQTDLYTSNADPAHPNQFGHNLDTLANARELRHLVLNEFT